MELLHDENSDVESVTVFAILDDSLRLTRPTAGLHVKETVMFLD